MVIVDTTVWIDYLGGILNAETLWLYHEMPLQRLGLTDMILCEVLQGIREPREFQQIRDQLLTFEIFPTGGAENAIAAAANYRTLRQRGYTVRKTMDCWIATFCLRTRNQLLHRDRDFEPFERALGLQVVHA
ncbi:MAG: PIN domain-containing protein [Acidobacteriia bacterium]|nr:PIN domain-containing protein [Terriglobia bacterium]